MTGAAYNRGNSERPCPYVSCKHHLYLDVTEFGGIKLNFPGLEVWELEETCALDVAERGGVTLDEARSCSNRRSAPSPRYREDGAEA